MGLKKQNHQSFTSTRSEALTPARGMVIFR